jgi:hypothetical protein
MCRPPTSGLFLAVTLTVVSACGGQATSTASTSERAAASIGEDTASPPVNVVKGTKVSLLMVNETAFLEGNSTDVEVIAVCGANGSLEPCTIAKATLQVRDRPGREMRLSPVRASGSLFLQDADGASIQYRVAASLSDGRTASLPESEGSWLRLRVRPSEVHVGAISPSANSSDLEVVAKVAWGAGPDKVGRTVADGGVVIGPGGVAVTRNGVVAIADSVNDQLVSIDGGTTRSIPVPIGGATSLLPGPSSESLYIATNGGLSRITMTDEKISELVAPHKQPSLRAAGVTGSLVYFQGIGTFVVDDSVDRPSINPTNTPPPEILSKLDPTSRTIEIPWDGRTVRLELQSSLKTLDAGVFSIRSAGAELVVVGWERAAELTRIIVSRVQTSGSVLTSWIGLEQFDGGFQGPPATIQADGTVYIMRASTDGLEVLVDRPGKDLT